MIRRFLIKIFQGKKRLIRELIKNKILTFDKKISEKNRYLAEGAKFLEEFQNEISHYISNNKRYTRLNIINQNCNLSCSYCVVDKVRKDGCKSLKRSSEEKQKKVCNVIDQFITRNSPSKEQRYINFNGGEFLLEFKVLEGAINYLKRVYPNENIKLALNSNGTLINEYIAHFLIDNAVDVAISIDGYSQSNDLTRRYRDGRGTFEDIIRGVQLLNKYRNEPNTSYQGTLIPNEEFNIEQIQEMADHGFTSARLGVDLLSIDSKQARKMARLHFKMVHETHAKAVKIVDNFYSHFDNVILQKEKVLHFGFFCEAFASRGLTTYNYNIDLEAGNLLCAFTPNRVSMDEIDFDIYHPMLFNESLKYLKNRFDAIKEHCLDCDLISICCGGCIMTGIDAFNTKNEIACIFMDEVWHQFLELLSTAPSDEASASVEIYKQV